MITIIHDEGAYVSYDENFLQKKIANDYFASLLNELQLKEEPITLYGKTFIQPRLIGWYGDSGTVYTYSKQSMEPQIWTPTLLELKKEVENTCQSAFNSVLVNLYRDGKDSMGWHSDDEKELGEKPLIASLSLGAIRNFRFRHRIDKNIPSKTISLDPGSLLVMKGKTQKLWQHAIPKTKKLVGPRLNLTFRYILS